MTNLKTKVIAVGVCAILVAGCSVLSPQPDHSRFYILTPVSDGSTMAAIPASTAPLRNSPSVWAPSIFPTTSAACRS